MIAAAVAGLADYTDTDGTARTRATLHATLMTVALVVYLVSLAVRASSPASRGLPIGLSIIGFLVGQVMKATRGQANAGMVQTALRERLDKAE